MNEPPRCRYALRLETILTRCVHKGGHNGSHLGRGLRKHPYQKIHWFHGDAREFLTDREDEYAWSERKMKRGEVDDLD